MSNVSKLVTGWNLNGRILVGPLRFGLCATNVTAMKTGRGGGAFAAMLIQNDDRLEQVSETIFGVTGWEKWLGQHPWFPLVTGDDVPSLTARLYQLVDSIPEDKLNEWSTGCLTVEHRLLKLESAITEVPKVELDLGDWSRPFG